MKRKQHHQMHRLEKMLLRGPLAVSFVGDTSETFSLIFRDIRNRLDEDSAPALQLVLTLQRVGV